MGPRPRRVWWRRLIKILLGLVALLVVLVGVVFALLHTDWARDKVRGIAVDQLNKKMNGTITIERLEGDLLDAITLRGVELRDREGKQILKADALTVDYRILPLLDNHFHADLIQIVGLEATLRRTADGRLVVADLWKPSPPGGAPWTTRLALIQVQRSAVKLERAPGLWDEVSRIEIEADVAVETAETRVALRSLDAAWKGQEVEAPVDLSVMAGLRIPAGGGMEVSGVDITAGRQRVIVPIVTLGPDGSRNAAFSVELSAAELARLWKPSPIKADVQLSGFVKQEPNDGRVLAHFFGGAEGGGFNLTAELGAGASAGDVGLFWAGVEPAAIVAGAPEGNLDGWVAGQVSGLSRRSPLPIEEMAAELRGGVSGVLRGVKVEAVGLEASLAKRRVKAGLRARAAFGQATADLTALLPTDLDDTGAITVEKADVRADLRDAGELEQALGRPVTVRGPVVLTASAHGRLDDLTAESRIQSARISQKELRLTGIRADLGVRNLDVQRVPGRAVGEVELHVDSIRNGPTTYGNAHLRATLTDGGKRAEVTFNSGGKAGVGARGTLVARIDPDGARVSFRELRVATKDLVWIGRGGRLEVTGGGKKISLDLGLTSAAGSIKLAGDLRQRGGQLRGPVRFDLVGLDLKRILAQVDRTGVTGVVSARGQVTLPEGPGTIELDATKVSWKGAPRPISGKVRVALEKRALEAHAQIDAGPLGSLKADVAGRTPALLTDGKAWGRLGPRAIDSLVARAENVDVARWVHTFGGPTTGARLRSGLAELDLKAGPGLETGDLTLKVTGGEVIAAPDLVLPISLDLRAGLRPTQLTLWTLINAADLGKLELDVSAGVPPRPLAAAGWKSKGLDLVQSIRLRVTNFDLARLQPPRVGKAGAARRSLELTGMVQAEVTAGAGARQLGAKVSFADLRVVDLAQPLSGELSLQAQPRATDVKLAIRLPSGPVVEGGVVIGLGADRIRRFDFAGLSAAMRTATLTGDLRIPDQPVARLASALQAKPTAAGRLRGEVTVRGSVAKPRIRAAIEAPGFTAQGVRFDVLRATGSYDAGPWQVKAEARQSDGGRVILAAKGAPGPTSPLSVHLDARRVKLGLFTPLWKKPGGTLTQLEGVLYANLDITGSTSRPIIDGSVQIRGGKARIAQVLRPFTNLRLDLALKKSQLQLTLSASSRPGKLKLTATGDFRRFDQASFAAKLDATKLPVQAGSQLISINGKAAAKGRVRAGMWDIGVTIDRGLLVRLPSSSGVQLHAAGPLDDVVFIDAAGAAQEAAREQLKKSTGPSMRIHIKSDDLVAVRSEELRLDLRIDLTATLVNGLTVMDGSVDGVRGWIEIIGRRYTLDRAKVLFAGEIPLDPRLDLRVSHQFPETLVFIDVSGRLSEPQVQFASDNGAYDQAQLLGLILGGEGGGGGGSLSEEAPGAAANVVANQVAGLIRQAGLPVDALRVGQEEGDAQSRYVTVGKWLSDRLFVAYKYRDSTDALKNRNEVTFQHFFTTNWMWEGTAGDRGAASIDLLWIVPLGR